MSSFPADIDDNSPARVPLGRALTGAEAAWHAFRQAHEEALRAPDGLLTPVAREVLDARPQQFSVIPGTWQASADVAGHATLTVTDTAGLLDRAGSKLSDPATFALPGNGQPVELTAGPRRIRVAVTGEERVVILRVSDPDSPARAAFSGVPTYAYNPALVVQASFTPSPQPSSLLLESVIDGVRKRLPLIGHVGFTLDGTAYQLIVYAGTATELHIPFRDTGVRSTGAHRVRVVAAQAPDGDFSRPFDFVLDFNRAVNGPAAYTPYASCALPPAESSLPFRIEAGEKPLV
jgi:uncharacterized protein